MAAPMEAAKYSFLLTEETSKQMKIDVIAKAAISTGIFMIGPTKQPTTDEIVHERSEN